MTDVHQHNKMDCSLHLCCLLWSFAMLAFWALLSLFIHNGFCIRDFHFLEHQNVLVHKIFMTQRVEPLSNNAIFMIFRQISSQTLVHTLVLDSLQISLCKVRTSLRLQLTICTTFSLRFVQLLLPALPAKQALNWLLDRGCEKFVSGLHSAAASGLQKSICSRNLLRITLKIHSTYAKMLRNLPRILSSNFFEDGAGNDQSSENEKTVALSLNLWTCFANYHASLRAPRSSCKVSPGVLSLILRAQRLRS